MTTTIKLTAAQAMMRWLSVQMTEDGERFIEGVWAIFGHGNVAGIGEALHGISKALPTWRGQNEQTMAHAAIAYAKTKRRRRAHAVTSSIGPGATNMAQPEIDLVAHAAAMGARAEKAADIAELEAMIIDARSRDVPSVIVIETDAVPGTGAGGHWWDVAVPQTGGPERLDKARARYNAHAALQRTFN